MRKTTKHMPLLIGGLLAGMFTVSAALALPLTQKPASSLQSAAPAGMHLTGLAKAEDKKPGERRHMKMRRGGKLARMCGPHGDKRAARRVEHMTGLFNDLFELNATQKAALDNFKKESLAARQEFKAPCATAKALRGKKVTSPQRLEMREKFLAARLAGMRRVRPAYTAFYESLSERQRRVVDRVAKMHRRSKMGGHHGMRQGMRHGR